jgi:glycosyltransferase involved in cell wall biosynthesis
MTRILFINTRHFYGGGDSTYTFNLADLLRSKGHEVAFFAMRDERNLPDPNADLFVSFINFRELNRRKSLATGLQVLRRVPYSTEARRKFGQMLDRFMPDVVHLQNIHAHITPSVIFEAKQRGLPVVWTLHDYKLICPNSHFLIDATGEICEACGEGAYYQAVLKRCKKGSLLASAMAALEAYAHRLMRVRERVDAFLAPSAFLRDKLIKRGFALEKVHHLPYVLPAGMFHNCDRDEGYLLFLGKLEPIKGIRPLLEACRLAPEVRLILAGRVEEPLASELPTLLPPNAQYVGMKQGEELRQLLHNALAVVLPSLWYENQPFSILEAFACGKPVVASNLGGMTELVAHEERGLLVRSGDVQALAQAMRWMVAHPTEARKMGQMAYSYVLAQHGPKQHYQRLMDLYGQVRGETG